MTGKVGVVVLMYETKSKRVWVVLLSLCVCVCACVCGYVKNMSYILWHLTGIFYHAHKYWLGLKQ